jgi:hypothetical protein
MSNQQLKDDGQMWKYFAPMLHMDDDDLDPYQYRLLGHYRRVCGANDGACTESTRTTATNAKMSVGKVSAARKELAELGRINVTETKKTLHITLNDCWLENITRYSACSPHEQKEDDSCSPGETKNNKSKEEQQKITPPSGDVVSPDAAKASKGKPSSLIVNDPEILIDDRVPTPKKERPPCKWEPLHDALLEVFGLEKAQMTPKADKIYWTVAHELYVVKMTPDQIPGFHTFMANKAKANDWSDWTVSAMAKYAPDFLRDGHKKAVPEFARGIHWVGGE